MNTKNIEGVDTKSEKGCDICLRWHVKGLVMLNALGQICIQDFWQTMQKKYETRSKQAEQRMLSFFNRGGTIVRTATATIRTKNNNFSNSSSNNNSFLSSHTPLHGLPYNKRRCLPNNNIHHLIKMIQRKNQLNRVRKSYPFHRRYRLLEKKLIYFSFDNCLKNKSFIVSEHI